MFKKYLLLTYHFALHDCNRFLKTSHEYLYPSDKCVHFVSELGVIIDRALKAWTRESHNRLDSNS